MMPPFVIFSLPRSRSKWLSAYLQYHDWQCGHDELRHFRSLEDVKSWLSQPCTGSCETAGAPFWRLLLHYRPDARIVTIRRPIDQVLASIAARYPVDLEKLEPVLRCHDRKLDQIEARTDALRFEYDDLKHEEICAALFEYCLPYDHDPAWWRALAALNLQANISHFVRYFEAYAPQVEKLRRLARHEMLRAFRRPVELDGVTFAVEPLAVAFADGERIMADECVAMGEQPEAWRQMNIPLLERLEAADNLHIMTARSNGRIFGYVVTAIGEAFHARDQLEAEQVSFFADAGWPGLGRKLQHASIEDLRGRGINRVLMFQPDTTRVGLVYRRLGAKQTGQRYVLELQ